MHAPQNTFKYWLSAAAGLFLMASGATVWGETEQWQTLSLAGSKLGYRHLERHATKDEIINKETLVITLSQPGAADATTTTVLEYRESPEGAPISISKRVSSATTNHNMRAVVDTNVLHLIQNDLTGNTTDYAIPQPFFLPEGLRQVLATGAGQTSPFTYFTWNFSNQQFEQIQLIVKPYTAADQPAYAWQIQRQVMTNQARYSEIFTDTAFRPLTEISRSGGDELRIENCSYECATADFQAVTHVYRQLIASPYKISDAALRGKIRYQLLGEFSDTPPSTTEQTVTPINGGVEITVCTDCAPETSLSPALLNTYLQTNYWLASDNAIFHTTVDDVLGERNISPAAKMRRLSHFVSRHMNSEATYSGYATALEAYHSKQGDCTEHALLLASLARAAGIPSRVVFGLAYNNERFLGRKYVFVPHAWVQAWTGEQWQSFDSGLGRFTAGHIALGISSGEQSEVLKINEKIHTLQITSAMHIKRR